MAAKSVSPPPEAYAILLYADEMPDGGFEPPDADEGVEAGAVGPLVDDAEDGQGVRILNAGGQIALAGHGYDELGAGLHDDAAGDGSPGGDGDLHAVGVPQVEYVLERQAPQRRSCRCGR